MKLRSRAFALAVAALAFAACDSQSGPSSSQDEVERVGNLKGALTLPDDTEITAVDFEITHPSGFVGPGPNGLPPNEASPRTGSIPVGNSTILTFRIGNLLVQNGYSLHLHAETSFGNTCDSTNTFDIADNGVTVLNVVLECTAQDNAGDLIVNGDFQTCPLVTALQAIPAEVTLGNDIALEAWISHGDSDVAWSGAGGDFSDDVGYTTTFTCLAAGSHVLTATISNVPGSPLADCDDARTLDVTCTLGAGCGNMQSDPGEGCDDGNTLPGDDCSATCQLNVCGDGDQDLLGPVTEACDDSNTITESCTYGLASCTVCDSTCHSVAGATHRCGDSATDTGAGETCDDGNAVTETCAYGSQAACTVCDSACHSVAGALHFCGDGVTDTANGEQCDGGASCDATCHSIVVAPPLNGTAHAIPACADCREANCRDIDFSGIDALASCFQAPTGGVSPADAQLCVDVLNCAYTNNCSYGSTGLNGCWCTANAGTCQSTAGLDANHGVCFDLILAASKSVAEGGTRDQQLDRAIIRLSQQVYPSGAAYWMLECDRGHCAECTP